MQVAAVYKRRMFALAAALALFGGTPTGTCMQICVAARACGNDHLLAQEISYECHLSTHRFAQLAAPRLSPGSFTDERRLID
jgi:hypothetical protein